MNILEVAASFRLCHRFVANSGRENERKILGSVTKSALLDYIIQQARSSALR